MALNFAACIEAIVICSNLLQESIKFQKEAGFELGSLELTPTVPAILPPPAPWFRVLKSSQLRKSRSERERERGHCGQIHQKPPKRIIFLFGFC